MNKSWLWLKVRIWTMQLVVLVAKWTGNRKVRIWATRRLMEFIPELLSHIPPPHMDA